MEYKENSTICTSCDDALKMCFSFTHGTSSWPPVAGKEYIVKEGVVEKIVHGYVSSGTLRTVTVNGLQEHFQYIDKFNEADFTVSGTSPLLADGSPRPICTAKRHIPGGVARNRENFPYQDGPFKTFLDFDRPAGVPCPDWRETLAKLIEIYPEFADVGFCIRASASSGIYLEDDPEPKKHTGGERWDFLFRSGLDVEKFVEQFHLRTWLAGYGAVKIDKGGSKHLIIKIDEHTEIDLSVFPPEHIDFCGSNPTREGLRRRKWDPIFIKGGCLKLAPELSPVGVAQAQMLQQAALNAADPEAKQRRDARRAELGKVAARTTGSARVGKTVSETLERRESVKSQSRTGYPIIHASLGQRLNFVGIGDVDVVDVLRDSEAYDECTCDDPINPEKGAKAIFYSGKHRQVFSFASHGYLLRLAKVEINFDHEHPLDTMREVDCILCSGKFPDLFVRGGEIVKVSRDGQIKPVSKENLPMEVCRLVKFLEWRRQPRDGGWELAPMSPSLSWWQAYANRVDSGLPVLVGVRAAPFLDGDRIVCRRGYDVATSYFLTDNFRIDEGRLRAATRETASAALERFLRPFRYFPFVHEVDKIAFVACCITAVQRGMLGNVPAFMNAARCAGTGKTLLAEAVSEIATGRRTDPLSFKADEAEMSKTWLSILREGSPLVLLDNINVRFGGDDLCTILTSEYYRGRILGVSKTASLPTNNILIVGTANNPAYLPDMPRRVIEINLDARCERPQDRVFDEDLLWVVAQQRVELLSCLFEILAAYDNAGRPAVSVKAIGSFETFVDQISRPLMWLVGVDVAEAMPSAVADDDAALLADLIQQWRECVGHGKATLADALSNPLFRAWACEYFADARASVNKQKLGKFLQKQAGRIIDGWSLVAHGTTGGVRVWQLETV
jgi:hypothetical protein